MPRAIVSDRVLHTRRRLARLHGPAPAESLKLLGGRVVISADATMMDHQINQNRRRAQALAERASAMRGNLDKIRSRMSESGIEYVACSPEEALAMVRDDASSSSSTSSRVSDPSNAPELPTIRASAAHVAYAIDQGGCMEVIAIGLRTGTIEIQFPNTRPDPGLHVEDGFCDANAAAHQVGTPRVPHKAPPPPYAGAGLGGLGLPV